MRVKQLTAFAAVIWPCWLASDLWATGEPRPLEQPAFHETECDVVLEPEDRKSLLKAMARARHEGKRAREHGKSLAANPYRWVNFYVWSGSRRFDAAAVLRSIWTSSWHAGAAGRIK